jgi:hypothetical protein
MKCHKSISFLILISTRKPLIFVDDLRRFDPEDESELANNTEDGVDLKGKFMRFMKDRECNNGENHTTQGDCRAKVRIHISETRSVQVDRRTTNFDLPLPAVNTVSSPFKYAPLYKFPFRGNKFIKPPFLVLFVVLRGAASLINLSNTRCIEYIYQSNQKFTLVTFCILAK